MAEENTNPYTEGYIMPVLSVDEPKIVAPFTAENFRKANDIASNADVQTSIATIREYIGDIREYIGDIQSDIEGNIKGDITSTVALGGIAQNATFTDKTALEILSELLNVEGFPVAPGLPTITATMTVNGSTVASSDNPNGFPSYQLGETLETVRISGSNPNKNKITQYKTSSGQALSLTKFKYYDSGSNTIKTIDKNDAYYAGVFQGYIDEYTGDEKFIGPQNSYSYTIYGVFNDGNEYVGTKRTATDYNKTKTVQYTNTSANRAKASVSFTVTIPWFAIGKTNTKLTPQFDKNFSYTSLPTNSMTKDSKEGGMEALNESSTSDLRMAFLVPWDWLGSKSFKIYQFSKTSETYSIDRTDMFKLYKAKYTKTETEQKFNKISEEILDDGTIQEKILEEIPVSTTDNIKGTITYWAYIVHEGKAISNWNLFLKKE